MHRHRLAQFLCRNRRGHNHWILLAVDLTGGTRASPARPITRRRPLALIEFLCRNWNSLLACSCISKFEITAKTEQPGYALSQLKCVAAKDAVSAQKPPVVRDKMHKISGNFLKNICCASNITKPRCAQFLHRN